MQHFISESCQVRILETYIRHKHVFPAKILEVLPLGFFWIQAYKSIRMLGTISASEVVFL